MKNVNEFRHKYLKLCLLYTHMKYDRFINSILIRNIRSQVSVWVPIVCNALELFPILELVLGLLKYPKLSCSLVHDQIQMQKWWNFCYSKREKEKRGGGNSLSRQSEERTQMRVIATNEITFLETHAKLHMAYNKPNQTIQCTPGPEPAPKPIKPNILPGNSLSFRGPSWLGLGGAEPEGACSMGA